MLDLHGVLGRVGRGALNGAVRLPRMWRKIVFGGVERTAPKVLQVIPVLHFVNGVFKKAYVSAKIYSSLS